MGKKDKNIDKGKVSLKSKEKGPSVLKSPYLGGFGFIVGLLAIPTSMLFIISFLVVFANPAFQIPIQLSGVYFAVVGTIIVIIIMAYFYIKNTAVIKWSKYRGG